MQLIKTIPARTETVKFIWCREFLPMSIEYRNARKTMSKPMDTCFWCSHKFIDGEMMYLGGLAKKGNKILCSECFSKITE